MRRMARERGEKRVVRSGQNLYRSEESGGFDMERDES